MTTERVLLDALHRRLDAQTGAMARRHILAEHVRSQPNWGGGIADAISVDTWRSAGYAISGYEVKCSRSDWLRELRDPAKADIWKLHCARWWLVAVPGVVKDDLPAGWGLLECRGRTLFRVVEAPELYPYPLNTSQVAGLARAIQTTALRRAASVHQPITTGEPS